MDKIIATYAAIIERAAATRLRLSHREAKSENCAFSAAASVCLRGPPKEIAGAVSRDPFPNLGLGKATAAGQGRLTPDGFHGILCLCKRSVIFRMSKCVVS